MPKVYMEGKIYEKKTGTKRRGVTDGDSGENEGQLT